MEIGVRLKEARESKNLSLDDVQKITKIQTRYLQAIEKGNFQIMPGNFYVRAFIKEYATAVDLDPDQLMEEYKSELPVSTDDSSIQYSRVQRSRKDTTSVKSPAIFSFLPSVIVVLLIVGIAFAIWYFYQQSLTGTPDEPVEIEENGDQVTLPPDQNDEDNSQEGTQEQPTEEEPVEEEEEPINPEPDSSLTMVEQGNGQTTYDFVDNSEQLNIELTTTDRNWLEIENGLGKSFYYDTLTVENAPAQIDMTGEQQVYLKFGNPSTISIKVNDEELVLPENMNPSQVQEVWINVNSETP